MTDNLPLDGALPGRSVRKAAPRSGQGIWTFRSEADRDPVAILQKQAAARVPELVPFRYGRMLASPFAHFRGGAAIMSDDLALTPTTGINVQLCGDAHLANFGGFAAPDRKLVFDLNDFDETLPGPFEWDVKRLSASFAVAGRQRGFSANQRASVNEAGIRSYQVAMIEFSRMPRMAVWHTRLYAADATRRWWRNVDSASWRSMRRRVVKSSDKTSERAFTRYFRFDKQGAVRPVSSPPLLTPLEALVAEENVEYAMWLIKGVIKGYLTSLPLDRQELLKGYEVVAASRKVVGVGSVGTRCWIVLLADPDAPHDVLVLQVKEATRSVLEDYIGDSAFDHHGRRVVEGQRLMQAASDTLLGWETSIAADAKPHDFYVRQMWDGKVSADLEALSVEGYRAYAKMCGWTLARAHAKTGDRRAIAAYLGRGGKFAAAIVAFGEAYAEQNAADYALLERAVAEGRVPVGDG